MTDHHVPEEQGTAEQEPDEETGDEQQVHPGWAAQSQADYDAGNSGGWGGPGDHLTGPIPKIRPASERPDES